MFGVITLNKGRDAQSPAASSSDDSAIEVYPSEMYTSVDQVLDDYPNLSELDQNMYNRVTANLTQREKAYLSGERRRAINRSHARKHKERINRRESKASVYLDKIYNEYVAMAINLKEAQRMAEEKDPKIFECVKAAVIPDLYALHVEKACLEVVPPPTTGRRGRKRSGDAI
jgi:hypothetical protein